MDIGGLRIPVIWGETIAILFAFSSLFTHNNLEHAAMMVVLAIAVSLLIESPAAVKVWQLHQRYRHIDGVDKKAYVVEKSAIDGVCMILITHAL